VPAKVEILKRQFKWKWFVNNLLFWPVCFTHFQPTGADQISSSTMPSKELVLMTHQDKSKNISLQMIATGLKESQFKKVRCLLFC
jgi:hypothetical protein